MSTFTEARLRLDDHISLSYAVSGDPDGHPVLLLHGYSDSWRSFRPLMRELPATVRAIAVSLRGHGDSSKPEAPYGTAAMAGDVVALMNHLGLERATIVGHSMGSLVAQRLAQDYPQRAQRLVLIGAFATFEGHADVDTMWRDVISRMTDPIDPAFVREFQVSTLAQPVQADFLADVIAESLKVPAHIWRGALGPLLAENRTGLLDRITAETLIIWGDRDAYSSRVDQERLAHAIPNARLIIRPGAGHSPHWEDPSRVAADIAAGSAAIGICRREPCCEPCNRPPVQRQRPGRKAKPFLRDEMICSRGMVGDR